MKGHSHVAGERSRADRPGRPATFVFARPLLEGRRIAMAWTLPAEVVPALGAALWPVTFVVLEVITNVYFHRCGRWRILRASPGSGRWPVTAGTNLIEWISEGCEQDMGHDGRNADIRGDLEIISNSMHMLPPWVPVAGRGGPAWWSRFEELSQGYSLQQLAGYLTEITEVLDPDVRVARHQIHNACAYVLKFFDSPALYEHLDEVAAGWRPAVPGRAGMRWSETICSAAWRVLVATEPYGMHARGRFVPPS